MKVELQPGESVVVVFAGTDGEITTTFGKKALTVESDLPDDQGRVGCIYAERFDGPDEPSEMEELRAENARLKAIVDTLPVEFEPEYDADGEPLEEGRA